MRTITALLLAVAFSAPALADWPRFMGPAGSGIAPEKEKISKTLPEGGLKELWKRPIASGFGVPAIGNGRVYILDRPGGGATEVFSVLELESGKEEWKLENESQKFNDNYGTTRGAPAIEGTMAYTIGITGDVLAIDMEGKKVGWKKNISSDFGAKPGGWGYAMSPVILRDMLLVDTPGSKDSGVVALDKKTGNKLWSSPAFGGADTYTTPVVVTIGDVEQVVSWHRGTVAGVSAKDGSLLWKYDWRTNRPIPDPVYVGNGRFFLTIGYGGGCAMIDVKKSGEKFEVAEVFKDDRSASKVANAVFYKGFIYTNSSDQDQGLQCMDPDGNIKWKSKQKFGNGSMIIADGTILIINGNDGTLFAVEASPEAYKELWKAKILEGREVWAPLGLSDGKLVVRDKKTLKCLDVGAK